MNLSSVSGNGNCAENNIHLIEFSERVTTSEYLIARWLFQPIFISVLFCPFKLLLPYQMGSVTRLSVGNAGYE